MSKSTPTLPARISLTPDEVTDAQTRVGMVLSSAPSMLPIGLTISSPAGNQAAVDFLRDRLDPAIDFCNSLFTPILTAIDQLRSATQQSQFQLTGPMLDLKRRLRAALQSWDDHLRAVQRQIDTDRAIEVARLSREILEQDTLNKANELIEEGREDDATVLLESFFDGSNTTGFDSETAQLNFALPSSKAGSRAAGQSSSTLHRARVIDIDKLKPEYVIKSPDTRKIQSIVTKYGKAAESLVSVDGKGGAIEYYEKGSVSVRKRKPMLLDDITESDIDYIEGIERD